MRLRGPSNVRFAPGVFVVLLVAVSLVATACGSGGGSSSGGKRVLRYGYDLSAQFTNTFDVQQSKGDCDAIALAPIYDTLVHKQPGNKLVPGLLESWKVQDPSTIDLTLRDGLTFSDGTPLDAAALQQALQHNSTNDQLSDLRKIAGYQVVTPSTWDMSPRDKDGKRGPLEEALVGAPIVDAEKPMEAVRIVHSFDP